MSDDPNLNPWLRPYTVIGRDARGEIVTEKLPFRPPYYFWLGADAYPEWPTVTSLVMKAALVTARATYVTESYKPKR